MGFKSLFQGLLRKAGIDIRLVSTLQKKEKLRHLWLQQSGVQCIFDVGANQGQFATQIRRYFPHTDIYSFEPIDACFNSLQQRFQSDPNFKVFQYAVGDENTETTFHVNESSPSSSLLKMQPAHYQNFPGTQKTVEQKVSVRTLDSLFPDWPADKKILLKIDVQGFEYQVLKGASELLRHVEVILAEVMFEALYESQSTFDQLKDLLREHGFRFHGQYDQELSPINGKPIFADLIFVRK